MIRVFWIGIAAAAAAAIVAAWWVMIRMPGLSHGGPLPPPGAREAALREELRATVERLADGTLRVPGRTPIDEVN